jgi:hypothetical protein
MIKFIPILACALFLGSQPAGAENVAAALSSPHLDWAQGRICTREHRPVCGRNYGRWRTYPNRCVALANGARNIRPGRCPRYRW